MKTWIIAGVAALLLSGCVSTHTREVVYREPYHSSYPGGQGGQYAPEYSYRESYAPQSRYQGGDTYYSPAWRGSGDYYYSSGYSYSYIDYPVYYSVFWPINRWYYDPFHYPGYYYGVTWYPQSYFSFGLGWSRPWGHYGLSYSPYRYSWVDNYYDWYPWYSRYPRYRQHYPTPRYGDARAEARRLADLRPPVHDRPHLAQPTRDRRLHASDLPIAPAYSGNRAADYGGRGTVSRLPPTVGAFGNPVTASTPRASNVSNTGGTRGQLQTLSRGEAIGLPPQDVRQDVRREQNVRDVRGIPVAPRQNIEQRGHLAQPIQGGARPYQGVQTPRTQVLSPTIRNQPVRSTTPSALHELRGTTRMGSTRSVDMPRPVVRQGGMLEPQAAPLPSRRAYSTGGAAPMPQAPRHVAPMPQAPRSAAPMPSVQGNDGGGRAISRPMPRMEPRSAPSPAPRPSSSRSELRAIHEN